MKSTTGKFKNNLAMRVALPSVLAIILVVSTILFVFIPTLEKNLLKQKRSTLQDVNEMAFNMLRQFEAGESSGLMTRKDAQAFAVKQIRSLRYGRDQSGYFWIIDMHPRVVLNPLRPNLEGLDAGTLEDADGKRFFNDFVRLAKEDGAGFVDYTWQKEASMPPIRKLSYARLFEPWGWIVGSGAYLDDVQAEIVQFKIKTILVLFLPLFILSAFALYFIHEVIAANRMREKADNTLQESEMRFRNLFEQSNDAIILHQKGEIVHANHMACRLLGYPREQLLQKNIQDIETEPDPAETAAGVKERGDGPPRIFETRWRRKDGTSIEVEISNGIVDADEKLFQATGRDITARKREVEEKKALEQKLRHAMRMETIGTLAGGIAHDFNNILSAIIGYADLAKDDLPEDHPLRYHIKQILAAGFRAKDLVRQILAFSRQKEDVSHQMLQLQPLIKETIRFLRASLPATIDIETDITAGTGQVFADATQIHQVLMNICTNAAQAMAHTGGTLLIRLMETELDEQAVSGHPGARPGMYLRLQVCDTGVGIPPEISDRIFDPFFTTKPRGEGTGMGLSVVHGIVKEHHGIVHIQSVPEEGTRVEVLLPIAAEIYDPA